MEDVRNVNTRGHRITLNNRGNGTITGVITVISFDPNEILLETEQGMLLIKGTELNVTKLTLDKGEVEVDGRVDSFTYSDMKPGLKGENGLFDRLFK
ncbi:MAG: sporulation protein YabP [Lachnospiraceae bacterium]